MRFPFSVERVDRRGYDNRQLVCCYMYIQFCYFVDNPKIFTIRRTSTGLSHGRPSDLSIHYNVSHCGKPCENTWWTEWHKHCFVYFEDRFKVRQIRSCYYN